MGYGHMAIETDYLELYPRICNKKLEGCELRCMDLFQKIELGKSNDNQFWSLDSRAGKKAAYFIAADVRTRMVPEG